MAKKTAEKLFSKVPKVAAEKLPTEPLSPKNQNIVSKNNKFKQAFLEVGYPAPKLGGEGYAPLKMINALLGARMTARLFIELREKLSLAYEVNSGYPTRKELSRFFIYIGLEKKNIELAKKRISEILGNLKKTPVGKIELEETRNYLKGTYILDHQSISRQAWYLGFWDILGKGYDYDETYMNEILAVTPDQIMSAAKKFFTNDSVTVEVIPE